MFPIFTIVCIGILLITLCSCSTDKWLLSLLPLSLAPLVVHIFFEGTSFIMWLVGSIILTTLPMILNKNKELIDKTFTQIMTTICITNITFITMVFLSLYGLTVISMFNTVALISWSTILYILIRDKNGLVNNLLHNIRSVDWFELYTDLDTKTYGQSNKQTQKRDLDVIN